MTEKEFPIEWKSILSFLAVPLGLYKANVGMGIILLLLLLVFLSITKELDNTQLIVTTIIILIFSGYGLITRIFAKINFKLLIDGGIIHLKQGTIKERKIPLSSMKNIYVQQGSFDKFLGLASIVIELQEQYFNQNPQDKPWIIRMGPIKINMGDSPRRQGDSMLVTDENRVIITGLSKHNAEKLRDFLTKIFIF